jgi:uncharacterized protein YegP (UPF0339 family)
MNVARLRKIRELASVVGIAVCLAAQAAGALANPGPARATPAPLPAQARAGRAAAARAATLVFEIYQDRSNEHRWRLKATNGQVIATSGQGYKDKRDVKSAIERIKADAATRLRFETYVDTAKEHRWRLKATNGQIIATSGQGYVKKADCDHAIDVIKEGAKEAKVQE